MLQSKYKKIELFVNENAVLQSYQSCVDEMKSNEGILLAGSDQIWSTLNHPIDELYLFNFVHDKHHKKYSYATSTGISEFSKEQLQYYANALREFEVVSFRELQVYEKLKEYLPVEQIRYDVDPTLLYDGESWSSLTAGRKIEGKYIFVYMLRPDNRLIKIARKLSKETKCKIVYMGLYVNKYAGVQTVVDAGVEDYLSYIRYADYVVTNSFHGTVFSMQFHRKFVSMKLESTSSRAENILRIAGLENRLIADIESSKIITEEIDYNCVDKKLQAERQKSVQYLQSLKFGTEL